MPHAVSSVTHMRPGVGGLGTQPHSCWSIQGAQAQRGQHGSATPPPCHNEMSLFQPPRPCGTPTPALPPGRRSQRRQPCGWRWLEAPRLVLLKKRAGRPWSHPQRGLITTSECVGPGLECPGAQQSCWRQQGHLLSWGSLLLDAKHLPAQTHFSWGLYT